jgi:hypothetical protein
VRDIYVSRLENGKWTEAARVHEDGWTIPACPVNGPMLAARGTRVAIAWFTAAGDQGRVFVAFSDDAGRTFRTPIRVDEAGSLGRVDVELMEDGSAVVSHIEFAEQRAQFRARRIEHSGARSSKCGRRSAASGPQAIADRMGNARASLISRAQNLQPYSASIGLRAR